MTDARAGERPGPISVLIADDQGMVRAGLRMIIGHEPDLVVAGEASDGQQAVAASRALAPDIVLMDVRMPHLDGISATRTITSGGGRQPAVVVLTTFDDQKYVLGAVRASASALLLKDAGPDALVAAVLTVHHGDALVDPQVTRTLIARHLELQSEAPAPAARGWTDALARLSEQEQVVLRAMAQDLSNRELAGHLRVGETTVKSHASSLLTTLGLDNRVQAVVLAYEAGVVRPGHTADERPTGGPSRPSRPPPG